MKAQCERCKEIVLLVFKTEAAGIRVRCPSCAADYFVAGEPAEVVEEKAPELAEPAEPDVAPEMICPKCGEPQKKAESCRRCGLHVDNFSGWEATRAEDSDIELGEVRAAAELFAACEASWED